ncbi:MAG TPA: adenylate kinase [Acidimicrobiia bacterium]|nr:adenylate kinase [Acidimicrobiia bacterium]
MRLLFIGPPGAGKGTQAGKVAARVGIPHISTGDMFRDNVAQKTELGMKVQAILDSGGYVPDEITVAMLRERISEDDAAHGFILDGFPRTQAQVAYLDELLGEDGLDKVVVFRVDEDELTERLLSRGRTDDTEETIRARFGIYTQQTQPLIDIYTERGLTVWVDGIGEVEEVTDRILEAIS